MNQEILFYVEDDRWYADLPDYIAQGGSKEDCEMVAGADHWLEIISQGGQSVRLEVSDTSGENHLRFVRIGYGWEPGDEEQTDPMYGATYSIQELGGVNYDHLQMWLCPVTLFVFGRYPDKIYYDIISI